MNLVMFASIPALVISFYWMTKIHTPTKVWLYANVWGVFFIVFPLMISVMLGIVMQGVTGPYSAFMAEVIISIAIWIDKKFILSRQIADYKTLQQTLKAEAEAKAKKNNKTNTKAV